MSVDSRSRWPTLRWSSTVGKKIVMALTGAAGVGYLVAHVLGNLLVFRRGETIKAYAAFLKSNMALLWTVRLILIAAVTLHIVAACQFARTSQRTLWQLRCIVNAKRVCPKSISVNQVSDHSVLAAARLGH